MDFRIVLAFCLCWQVNAQGQGDLRLAGTGSNATQGRVEVFINGVWGTVCDDQFDVNANAASVVCKQLGLNRFGAQVITDKRFGEGSDPIWFDGVTCDGTEQRLMDCPMANWNTSDCSHTEDIGVICSSTTATPPPTLTTPSTVAPVVPDSGNCSTPDPDIRLLGPSNEPGIGVVQIRNGGVWGGVCDNNWDATNARIVCRSLCYDPNLGLPGSKAFDTSNIQDPMTVNNVDCGGSENSLLDCPQDTWTIGTCGRNEMARVTCVTMDNSPPTRPEPVLDCSGGHLTASFSRTRDPKLEEKHLSVDIPYTGPCSATKSTDDSFITISIPFYECGTTRSYNATHIIYRNIVRYLPTQSQGSVSNTNTYIVQIRCEMARNSTANKPEEPILPLTEVVTQTAPGEFIVNMYFFRNNSFVTAVTQFPLQIPLGEWLSTALGLENVDPNLRLIVPNCYATPSSDRNDAQRYPLFTDKCVDDNTVGFFPLNDTWFGYRYQTFKFVQFPEVYIHCDAIVCGKDETDEECDRSCFPATSPATTAGTPPGGGPAGPSGRKKRSVHRQAIHVSSPSIMMYDPAIPPPEIVRPSLATPRPTEATPPVTQAPPTSRPPTKIPEITRLSTRHTTESETQQPPDVATPPSLIGQVENIISDVLHLSDGSGASAILPCVGLLCCLACLIQIFQL